MLPRADILNMDPAEWQVHQDTHDLKTARETLEKYSLAGVKKTNGHLFGLADLLPPHLAKDYLPNRRPEADVFEAFKRLAPHFQQP